MTWRKTAATLAWWSLGVSTVVTTSLWLAWGSLTGQARSVVGDLVVFVFDPALTLAILLSGHSHDLNPVAWFGAQAAQLLLMSYLAGLGIVVARRLIQRVKR